MSTLVAPMRRKESLAFGFSLRTDTATGASRASSCWYRADRACRPRSRPNTSTRKSDAPLSTDGASRNPTGAFTKPNSRTTRTRASKDDHPRGTRLLAQRLQRAVFL